MKALVWEGPFRLTHVDVPRPVPLPGEVIVRVTAVGICGSELEGYVGKMANRRPPLIMGHEFEGVVTDDDDGDLRGQRVAVNPLVPCGICRTCADGLTNLCPNRSLLGITRSGGFATFVSVPVTNVVAVPAATPTRAAAIAEPLANAMHALARVDDRQLRKVTILGAGSLGLLVLQCARRRGLGDVLVVDIHKGRLDIARRLGASVALADPSSPGEIQGLLDGGPDLVIDAVGSANTKQVAINVVADGGAIVLLGLHDDSVLLETHKITRRELSVVGSFLYRPEEFVDAVNLIAGNEIEWEPFTDFRPLSEGPSAFDDLVNRPGIHPKVMLLPEME